MRALDRRQVLGGFAAAGLVALLPAACATREPPPPAPLDPPEPRTPDVPHAATEGHPGAVPWERPEGWNPIAFNRDRGNAGFIPESYRAAINGPDGATAHLGKHLPYVPALAADAVPAGFLAIMWGDPAKGHAKHPNAAPSEELPGGHFYDWIRVRKAVHGIATEVESTFTSWPDSGAGDSGRYTADGGPAPTDESGKDTVNLCRLPEDVRPGDLVRIHAHCRTHGEYVDFVVVPG